MTDRDAEALEEVGDDPAVAQRRRALDPRSDARRSQAGTYQAAENQSATSAPAVLITQPAIAGATIRLPKSAAMLSAFAVDTRSRPTRSMISVNRTGWNGACIVPIARPAISTCQ